MRSLAEYAFGKCSDLKKPAMNLKAIEALEKLKQLVSDQISSDNSHVCAELITLQAAVIRLAKDCGLGLSE